MTRWIIVFTLLLMSGSLLFMVNAVRADGCIRDVTFTDAVLYAGATDYVFRHQSGMMITVRVPNALSEMAGADHLMALQSDGPAEANPDRLEQPHDLCDADGGLSITMSRTD